MCGDEPDGATFNNVAEAAFPACAGMNRQTWELPGSDASVPRMCGDEPNAGVSAPQGCGRSPHVRG